MAERPPEPAIRDGPAEGAGDHPELALRQAIDGKDWASVVQVIEGDWRRQLPGLLGQTGATRLKADDVEGAIRPLQWAYEHAAEAAFDYVEREAAGNLALAFALAGDVEEAEIWLSRHDHGPPTSG